MNLLKILTRPIAFQPIFARITSSATAGLFLSQLYYWHDRGNATFFFDPPYWIGSNLYGNGGDLHKHFDHQEFAEYLFNLDNWILCYNDRPEIRSLYANYKIVTPEWSYGMGKNKSSREVLILNI